MNYKTSSCLTVVYTDGGERLYERDGYFPSAGDTFEENVVQVYYTVKPIVKSYPELKEFWLESRTEIVGDDNFTWFIKGDVAPTAQEPKNIIIHFGSNKVENKDRQIYADMRRIWEVAHHHPNPFDDSEWVLKHHVQ